MTLLQRLTSDYQKIWVYIKNNLKNQPFNNQRYRKIDVLLQAKIYHCFLWIYPLQQSHCQLLIVMRGTRRIMYLENNH